MRVQKRKCPMAVNDKFCSEAIRNQLESSIASRAAIRVAYEHGTDATYNLITSTFKYVCIILLLLQTCINITFYVTSNLLIKTFEASNTLCVTYNPNKT